MSKGLVGLYTVMYFLMALMMLATSWFVVSTDMFVRPTGIFYDGRKVTLVRQTPFGDMQGRWWTEIRVANSGLECDTGPHFAPYQQEPDDTVTYYLGEWATPCIEEGPPLVIVDTWQVLLFDLIPLRPVEMTTVIKLSKGDSNANDQ